MHLLGEFIVEKQADFPHASGDLSSLLASIRLAAKMQEDRITMEYQVLSKKWGKIATIATATGVMFDFKNNVKAAIPDHVRQSILDLEGTVGSTHHLEIGRAHV